MTNTYLWHPGTNSVAFGQPSNWELLSGGTTTAATAAPTMGDVALIGTSTVAIGGTPGAAVTVDGIGVMVTLGGSSALQPPLTLQVANATASASATVTLRNNLSNATTLGVTSPGATLDLTGQTLTNTGYLVVADGGTLIAQLPLVNAGTVAVLGQGTHAAVATLNSVTSGTSGEGVILLGSGTLDLANVTPGAKQTLNDTVDAGQTIVFTDGAGTLVIGDPANFAGTIVGFGAGDVIELPSTLNPIVTGRGGTITIQDGPTLTLVLDPEISLPAASLSEGVSTLGFTTISLPGFTADSWLGGSGDWSTAANWSNGGAPGSADRVQLLGSLGAPFTTTVSTTETAQVVTLLSPAGTRHFWRRIAQGRHQPVRGQRQRSRYRSGRHRPVGGDSRCRRDAVAGRHAVGDQRQHRPGCRADGERQRHQRRSGCDAGGLPFACSRGRGAGDRCRRHSDPRRRQRQWAADRERAAARNQSQCRPNSRRFWNDRDCRHKRTDAAPDGRLPADGGVHRDRPDPETGV
jgi:hypothetical protein